MSGSFPNNLVQLHHMGTACRQPAAINSRSLKDLCEPGPAQGFSLLKGSFTLSLLLVWGLGLWVCVQLPGTILINKVEINFRYFYGDMFLLLTCKMWHFPLTFWLAISLHLYWKPSMRMDTVKLDLMEKDDWIVTPEHERKSDSLLHVPGSRQIVLTDAKHVTIPRYMFHSRRQYPFYKKK